MSTGFERGLLNVTNNNDIVDEKRVNKGIYQTIFFSFCYGLLFFFFSL